MASSLQDPRMAHSLWLQRRSTRRALQRAQWRSDWMPVGLLLLLLGLLILLSLFLPSHDAVEGVKQATQDLQNSSLQLPVLSSLTEQ